MIPHDEACGGSRELSAVGCSEGSVTSAVDRHPHTDHNNLRGVFPSQTSSLVEVHGPQGRKRTIQEVT